ncbi:acyltransferase family protein [Rhizobium tubonense]|uniref:Acyltransferase n=1 Tax=Rhizobium tubonense TaxID=484088 RepID=A0A2W4EHI3_9HYPH|nr:acyltransferase [Rhizobium tubonense]PZM10590.1 acyltransferase [Rhizobium tubonense]
MKTLYGIQYLRALAALAVVFFHAAEKSGGNFKIGAAGVDVFFVISGFIMWVMSDSRPLSPTRFVFDRIQRIVPVYWIVTGVMIAGALTGLFPNMKLTFEHLLGSFFLIPVRSPSNGEIWPVLVQGWTLNFEMFFYAIFAIGLLFARRIQLVFLVCVFAAFALFGWLFHPQSAILATYTRPIILEFVAGTVLGELWLKGRVPRAVVGLVLVTVAACGFAAIQILQLDFNEFICGPLAVALILGILSLERHGAMPHIPVLAYLGNGSYSIYLWHTLAISVVAKAAQSMALPPLVAVTLSAILGALLGIAAYEVIEKPIRSLLKSLSWRRRPSPA